MKVKATIAFIGAVDKQGEKIINRLVQKGHPLVLINKPGRAAGLLSTSILKQVPDADIEVIDCEREACWEADVILLPDSTDLHKALLEKIRTVATQKILIRLTNKKKGEKILENEIKFLKQQLPNTKIVSVFYEENGLDIVVSGEDKRSLEGITEIFSL